MCLWIVVGSILAFIITICIMYWDSFDFFIFPLEDFLIFFGTIFGIIFGLYLTWRYWNVVKILLIIVAIICVLSLLVSLIKKVIKNVEYEKKLKCIMYWYTVVDIFTFWPGWLIFFGTILGLYLTWRYWNVAKILLIIVAIICVLSLLVSLIKKVIKKVEHENELKLFAINEENKTEEKKQKEKFKKLSNILFVSTIDLREHPLKNEKYKKRKQYFEVLMFLVSNSVFPKKLKDFTIGRLSKYFDFLLSELMSEKTEIFNQNVSEKSFKKNLNSLFCIGWTKNLYVLLSDLCLILQDETLISYAIVVLKRYLPKYTWKKIDKIYYKINNPSEMCNKYKKLTVLVNQYKANVEFLSMKEKRIIVTALVSSGKSTLINALVGESLTQTKSDVCTGNLTYICNKAFNDGKIHFYQNNKLTKSSLFSCATFDMDNKNIQPYDLDKKNHFSSYFNSVCSKWPRICFIDTPGVDADAINKEHGEIAKKALLNEFYDMIIYVVGPNQITSDSQNEYLQWIAKNLPNKKIIFVINKLDKFKQKEDSIADTITNFYYDLLNKGFRNPKICPVSAYFSFLLKQKILNKELTVDETDDFDLYCRKFSKSFFDLSNYYDEVDCDNSEISESTIEKNDLINISRKCGLYDLEKIIIGENK